MTGNVHLPCQKLDHCQPGRDPNKCPLSVLLAELLSPATSTGVKSKTAQEKIQPSQSPITSSEKLAVGKPSSVDPLPKPFTIGPW